MARPQAAGFQVVGLREVVRDLEALGVEVADLKEAFTAIGQDVADEAVDRLRRENVIRSGALAKSVKPSKAKNKAVVRAGSARAWYAAVVNKNPHGRRGTGFLTIPANSNVDERIARLTKALDDLAQRHSTGGTAL